VKKVLNVLVIALVFTVVGFSSFSLYPMHVHADTHDHDHEHAVMAQMEIEPLAIAPCYNGYHDMVSKGIGTVRYDYYPYSVRIDGGTAWQCSKCLEVQITDMTSAYIINGGYTGYYVTYNPGYRIQSGGTTYYYNGFISYSSRAYGLEGYDYRY
jgi:hypothetical protein